MSEVGNVSEALSKSSSIHCEAGDAANESVNKIRELPQKIDVDHILKHSAGNIGFVQISMVVLAAITLPAAIVFPVFGNTELPHRCRLDPVTEERLSQKYDPAEDSFDKIASLVGPWKSLNSSESHYGCERYKNPSFQIEHDLRNQETVPCDKGYVYKYSIDQYPGGIVNEWDLVCDQAWKVPFSTAMYMCGMLAGFVIGGVAGDRLGRRKTALVACVFEGLAVISVSLSPNFWSYIIFRVFLAFSSSIKIAVLLVLCMEMSTAHQRSIINGIWSIIQGFVLRVILSPLAMYFSDWRWFHGMLCATTFFSFPCIIFFPESPRWLVSQHRKLESLHELYKVYRVNTRMLGCRISKEPLLSEEEFIRKVNDETSVLKSNASHTAQHHSPPKSQFRQMLKNFRNRKMIQITIQCILLFAGQLATTFGLVFYGSTIRANIYLVNFLNSTTQIPASFISVLMYRYCKRRKMPIAVMYLSTFLILAAASIYNYVVKPDSDFVLNICCNLALILLSASLNMVFMYVPELFASEARSLGLGLASGLGRIGGVICPFVNSLDKAIFHGSPIFVYMGILALELFNLFWLPDTSGKNLSDNYERRQSTDEAERGDGDTRDSNGCQIDKENLDSDEQPVWASTIDELIASTNAIKSTADLNDDSSDVESIKNRVI